MPSILFLPAYLTVDNRRTILVFRDALEMPYAETQVAETNHLCFLAPCISNDIQTEVFVWIVESGTLTVSWDSMLHCNLQQVYKDIIPLGMIKSPLSDSQWPGRGSLVRARRVVQT